MKPAFYFSPYMCLCLLFSAHSSLAETQDISLFSSERNLSDITQPRTEVQIPTQKPRTSSSRQPKLKGISYIGGRYRFFFQNDRNKLFSLGWDGKTTLSIPAYEYLQIDSVDLKSRSVFIRFLSGKLCQDKKSYGLICINDTQGRLSMVRSSSRLTASPKTMQQANRIKVENKAMRKNKSSATKVMRRKSLPEGMAVSGIKRIKTDEIPVGMERIRTPFGDRLVPKK